MKFQKGMKLGEFRKAMEQSSIAKRGKGCGCSCQGCLDNAGHHCLTPPCTRQRNRRSKAQIEAESRSKPSGYGFGSVVPTHRKRPRAGQPGGNTRRSCPRPKQPKAPVSQEKPKMRTEWFVDATRGGTTLELAAPDGEQQAIAMRDRLIDQGWQADTKVKTTFPTDPRFHEISRETR